MKPHDHDVHSDAPRRRRHSKARRGGVGALLRRLTIIAVVLALLLVAGAALVGPKVAGLIAPGLIERRIGAAIHGDVSIGRMKLSWTGAQRINSVEIESDELGLQAALDINVSKGLLALLKPGSLDLGVITIGGDVTLAPTASSGDKANDASSASAGAAAGGSAGRLHIPVGLVFAIEFDDVTIAYDDPDLALRAGGVVGVDNLSGRIDYTQAAALTATLNATSILGGRDLKVAMGVDNLMNASGFLTPETATAHIAVSGSAPVSLAKLAPGLGELLAGADTDFVDMTLSLRGDISSGEATLEMAGADGAPYGANLNLVYADGRVTLSQPGAVTFAISEAGAASLFGSDANVSLDKPVTVTCSLEALDAPYRIAANSELDLRGASLKLRVLTTPVKGAVAMPADADARPFNLSPITVAMQTNDLGGPMQLQIGASAMFDGDSAGDLLVDLTADGLLDERGGVRMAPPPVMRGEVRLTGVASAILQPLLSRYDLSAIDDIGPSFDATLIASANLGDEDAPRAPSTAITFKVEAEELRADGGLLMERTRIRTVGDGVSVWSSRAAEVIGGLLAGAGVTVDGDAAASLTITGLDLPLQGDRPDLRAASGEFALESGGFEIRLDGPGSEPILTDSIRLEAKLSAVGPTHLRIQGAYNYDERDFDSLIDLDIADLFTAGGSIDVLAARPVGMIRARGVPVDLLERFVAAGEGSPIAVDVLGPTVDAVAGVRFAGEKAFTFDMRASTPSGAAASARALVTPGESISIRDARAHVQMTPATWAMLVSRYAPDLEPAPTLGQPVRLDLSADDFVTPLTKGNLPDLKNTPNLKLQASLAGDVEIRRAVTLQGRPIDAVLRGIRLDLDVAPSSPSTASAKLVASMYEVGSPEAPVANLDATATLQGGASDATVHLSGIDASRLDSMLDRPGFFDLSLGSPIDVSLRSAGEADGQTALLATITSPRLSTTAAVRIEPDSVTLTKPTTVRWTMDDRWARRYLTPPIDDQPARLHIAGPTSFDVRLKKLAIGRGDSVLKPGVFVLDAALSAPTIEIASQEGTVAKYLDASITAVSTAEPGGVRFTANVKEDHGASLRIDGSLAQLADASGVLSIENAAMTFDATGSTSSALLDVLADANGQLMEALGATVSIKAQAQGLSREKGDLRIDASSQRATFTITGHVRDKVFLADEPVVGELKEITPKLGELVLARLFPLLGKVEKRPEDGPARIEAGHLTLPLDGDPRSINGQIKVNLGMMRFETASFFSQLLQATNNRAQGGLFQEWPEFIIDIKEGVATYDRVRLPMGDFFVDTRGTVDLVKRRVNLVTFVPLTSLVGEIRRAAAQIPGVGAATMIPLRTKGRFGHLRTELAPELILESALSSPERVIDDVLNRFNPFGPKKKKKKKRP